MPTLSPQQQTAIRVVLSLMVLTSGVLAFMMALGMANNVTQAFNPQRLATAAVLMSLCGASLVGVGVKLAIGEKPKPATSRS